VAGSNNIAAIRLGFQHKQQVGNVAGTLTLHHLVSVSNGALCVCCAVVVLVVGPTAVALRTRGPQSCVVMATHTQEAAAGWLRSCGQRQQQQVSYAVLPLHPT
jgi:hypothetical protein